MRIKRGFDISVSAAGLFILSPLLLILAICVKVSSPGTVLYRGKRVGQYGHEFEILKFRSMFIDADKIGPAVTGAGDKRITTVGRLLRRTKLDELPQLWNVLIGEMSIVGPRPESPKYVALYTSEQHNVLSVRPGITSPASVQYRYEESMLTGGDWEQKYIDEIMPHKLAIDLTYVHNSDILCDIKILWQTLLILFH
ncbi:MAG: sugar transferase [Anaerolineae bacterium]|nr:sugar transferase [Anaerolineae bacterium]